MNINDFLDAPFTFTKRKNFTPCDVRPLWKSGLIVLIIGIVGRNNSASLRAIHTANWIVKKEDHLTSFMEWAGKDDRKRPNVRLEPAIDRIIDILVANNFLTKSAGKINLTNSGSLFFNELQRDDIYIKEKTSLIEAKKHLSEAAIKRLFEGV